VSMEGISIDAKIAKDLVSVSMEDKILDAKNADGPLSLIVIKLLTISLLQLLLILLSINLLLGMSPRLSLLNLILLQKSNFIGLRN
jgi:hypothetical protein